MSTGGELAVILSPPEESVLSRLERIEPVMLDYVKGNRLPGIMTLIKSRDKLVHLGQYSLMDTERQQPMFSMTK